jgi:hypothetical protein
MSQTTRKQHTTAFPTKKGIIFAHCSSHLGVLTVDLQETQMNPAYASLPVNLEKNIINLEQNTTGLRTIQKCYFKKIR